MTTDTDIREAFHAAAARDLAGLAVSPGVLADVRRRHARRQRALLFGGPLAVVILTVAVVLGAIAIGGSSGHGSAPHTANSGRTRTLLGQRITFPAGWTVQDDGPAVIELGNQDQPDSRDQRVDAASGNALHDVSIDVSSGQASVTSRRSGLGFVKHPIHTIIDGQPATFGASDSPHAAPVQAGVTLSNGDYLSVEAQGMTVVQLESFLAAALAG
jgi:hypothetical protein